MKIEAMLWIVVLILVALSFLFPKTRSFSLSAIGVAIVVIVAIVVVAKRGESPTLGVTAPPAVEQKPIVIVTDRSFPDEIVYVLEAYR